MPKRRELEAEAVGLRKLLGQRLHASPLTSAAATLQKMHHRRLARVEKEIEEARRRADRLL